MLETITYNEKSIPEKPNYVQDSFEEYLGKKSYVSASDLKRFKISPKHYKWYIDNPEEQENENRNLIVGSAIHKRLLEKELFNGCYACLKNSMLPVANSIGQKDYRTKANREYRDIEFPMLHKGKTILTEPEWDLIDNVCKSAQEHPTIQKLFKSGTAEISMYKLDEKTGLTMKGRTDWLPDFGNSIIDVKTCVNSSPRDFSKTVYNMGYNIQASHYLELFDRKMFLFFALEKSSPFTSEVYLLSEEVINNANDERRMLIDIYWWCKKVDYYPSYTEFESLKNIYKDGQLYDKDKDFTYNALCQFFEIKTGLHMIELPYYIK